MQINQDCKTCSSRRAADTGVKFETFNLPVELKEQVVGSESEPETECVHTGLARKNQKNLPSSSYPRNQILTLSQSTYSLNLRHFIHAQKKTLETLLILQNWKTRFFLFIIFLKKHDIFFPRCSKRQDRV